MSSKKKIILASTSCLMVVVAVVVAVVAVLAAQQVTIQSSVTVSYINRNVYANVRCSCNVGRPNPEVSDPTQPNANLWRDTMWFIGDAENYVELNRTTGEEITSTNEITINDLRSDEFVQFIFSFINTDPRGAEGDKFTATLTLPTTIDNFSVSKSIKVEGVDAYSVATDSLSFDVEPGQEIKYSVTFRLTNIDEDASISGDMAWELIHPEAVTE